MNGRRFTLSTVLRHRRIGAGVAMLLVVTLTIAAAPASSRIVVSDENSAPAVVVRDVLVRQGVVTGLLFNGSPKPVRDVRLLIRHQWVWANERKPGDDNPGRVAYYTVPDEVPPEITVQFTYTPDPPLPVRSDGRFETSVEVVGYAEVDR